MNYEADINKINGIGDSLFLSWQSRHKGINKSLPSTTGWGQCFVFRAML